MGIITDDAALSAMPRTAAKADAVVLLPEVGSTNTYARELIEREGEGRWPFASPSAVAVVATDRQTAGRGRLDHVWTSAAGESFTVSFVACVPRALATDESVNGWLQMIAGLSALDALREAAGETGEGGLKLKWPNDLFCGGLKLGGILAEMVMLPGEPDRVAVIFGIGINLAVPADRLPTPQSTSLQLHYALGRSGEGQAVDTAALRDRIAARLVASLRSRLDALIRDPHAEAPRLAGETRSLCWTLGHRVSIHYTDGTTLEATALALNDDASLTVRDDAGATRTVRTADVGVLNH